MMATMRQLSMVLVLVCTGASLVACDNSVFYNVENDTDQLLQTAWAEKSCESKVDWHDWNEIQPGARFQADYVTGDYARCIAIATDTRQILRMEPARAGRTFLVSGTSSQPLDVSIEDRLGATDPPPYRSLLQTPGFYIQVLFGLASLAGFGYGFFMLCRHIFRRLRGEHGAT